MREILSIAGITFHRPITGMYKAEMKSDIDRSCAPAARVGHALTASAAMAGGTTSYTATKQ